MAGRRTRMANLVGEFERRAVQLSGEVFKVTPDVYHREPESKDPIAVAWWGAINATMQASIALERLGDALRAKAGITGPSPSHVTIHSDAFKTMLGMPASSPSSPSQEAV